MYRVYTQRAGHVSSINKLTTKQLLYQIYYVSRFLFDFTPTKKKERKEILLYLYNYISLSLKYTL